MAFHLFVSGVVVFQAIDMELAEDTIFALASGVGRAGVAVLRLSGDAAGTMLKALAGALPAARRATLRELRDADGTLLDQALVLWFPAPASYTGEACAELHLHGGAAVISGVSDALLELGARPAEPGEFTRRAFLNGRMDLTEAEAVLDLIEAETASQRVQALRQLGGALGRIYESWRDRLTRLMAQQEALVDFPDEDLPPGVEAELLATLAGLQTEMRAHLDDERRGERLRRGVTIAVTGPPNVGKSSLVNSLAGRDIAIVSPAPGTTRDVLETRLVLGGVPVTLMDTAGLRETTDLVEAEGVRRARARARDADLVLHLREVGGGSSADFEADWREAGPIHLDLVTKLDLTASDEAAGVVCGVSVVTGTGLPALRERLAAEVVRLTATGSQAPLTRARHRAALVEAVASLETAGGAPAELRAENLRLALRSLGRVTGRVGADEILGVVFSQFCIGK